MPIKNKTNLVVIESDKDRAKNVLSLFKKFKKKNEITDIFIIAVTKDGSRTFSSMWNSDRIYYMRAHEYALLKRLDGKINEIS